MGIPCRFVFFLKLALQPCGWLAAFGGAALTCDDRLHFRNLGGKAKLIKNLTRTSGTVKVRVKMTESVQGRWNDHPEF